MFQLINLTNLFILLTVYYIYVVYNKFYDLLNPLHGVHIDSTDKTIDPLWNNNNQFNILCYLSTDRRYQKFQLTELLESNKQLIYRKNLIYNESINDLSIHLSIKSPDYKPQHDQLDNETITYITPVDIWKAIISSTKKSNKQIYLHAFILLDDKIKDFDWISKDLLDKGFALFGSVPLIKYNYIPKYYKQRYLLSDFGFVNVTNDEAYQLSLSSNTTIPYWKPQVSIRLMTDRSKYPIKHVPEAIEKQLVITSNKKIYKYKPPVHIDEIGLTSDKYIPINESVRSLDLIISCGSISLQRWLLMQMMEESLSSMVKSDKNDLFAFTDNDIDDVRRLISDTSIVYLSITTIASLLHLLFEFLAFKSDIQFWKSINKPLNSPTDGNAVSSSTSYMSVRGLYGELVTQIVIFVYLIDTEASMLIIIPSFISICILIWKIRKAKGFSISWIYKQSNEPIVEPSSKDLIINDADKSATVHLLFIFIPLLIGYSLKSLIYEKHISYYQWILTTLTASCYGFGFISMCPQLYINYKLKSVEHMPWKFLMYRFLNTFIDDLFAFLIKMPTMHRMSVFRDDIVFIIYLYQRWIYKIDHTRSNQSN